MLTQQLLKDGINKQIKEIKIFSGKHVGLPWGYKDSRFYIKQKESFSLAIFKLIACSRYLLTK